MDFLNTAEKRDRRMVHLPMGRFGEAVEIAKAALFLATDESSYMTVRTYTLQVQSLKLTSGFRVPILRSTVD